MKKVRGYIFSRSFMGERVPQHVENIVYADGFSFGKSNPAVPIGLGCRTCERGNCQHRGEPPLGREIKFDPNQRYAGLFEFSN